MEIWVVWRAFRPASKNCTPTVLYIQPSDHIRRQTLTISFLDTYRDNKGLGQGRTGAYELVIIYSQALKRSGNAYERILANCIFRLIQSFIVGDCHSAVELYAGTAICKEIHMFMVNNLMPWYKLLNMVHGYLTSLQSWRKLFSFC